MRGRTIAPCAGIAKAPAELAAHSYPQEVHFAESLPMTATGKVMRREIRCSLAGDGPATGRS